jgi:hypothetical protein
MPDVKSAGKPWLLVGAYRYVCQGVMHFSHVFQFIHHMDGKQTKLVVQTIKEIKIKQLAEIANIFTNRHTHFFPVKSAPYCVLYTANISPVGFIFSCT